MPYKFETDKMKIPKEYDRRRKLSEEDKEEIRKQYRVVKSQRKLAKAWNVSRRLITFILDPEKERQNKHRYKERGGSKVYYDRERHTKAMKIHRKRKRELYLKNKLKKQNKVSKE